jgi:hypothetical protein
MRQEFAVSPKVRPASPDVSVEIKPAEASPTLPQYLLDVLVTLPRKVSRRRGADLVKEHFFEVSHRTLEAWPLPTQLVNGRAITPTKALFEVAYEKLSRAPVVMGGRRPKPKP